jgi:hypothetical protein
LVGTAFSAQKTGKNKNRVNPTLRKFKVQSWRHSKARNWRHRAKYFWGVFGELGFFGVESPIKCSKTGVSKKACQFYRRLQLWAMDVGE